MQLPLPFELPDVNILLQTLAAVPLDKWVALVTGPAVFGVAAVIKKFFPSWGEGRLLFVSRLEKKRPLLGYVLAKSGYSWVPLVLSVAPWLNHEYWSAFALFSVGLTGTIHYWRHEDRLRGNIRFYENRFAVDRVQYHYDAILSVDKAGIAYVFKTKKFRFSLTQKQYEKVQPSLWKFGYGESTEYRPSLDLK